MPFTCSICGEESTRICVWCTKDACDNHLCEKCRRCSDCCECEVRLTEPSHEARPVVRAVAPLAPEPEPPGPDPEPQLPAPDPEPEPEEPSPVPGIEPELEMGQDPGPPVA